MRSLAVRLHTPCSPLVFRMKAHRSQRRTDVRETCRAAWARPLRILFCGGTTYNDIAYDEKPAYRHVPTHAASSHSATTSRLSLQQRKELHAARFANQPGRRRKVSSE